jgi:arginine exporter protein ArgO
VITSEFALSILIATLVVGVWCMLYLGALNAYRLPQGIRTSLVQLSLLLAAVAIFVFEVSLIDRLAPLHSHRKYFFFFVLVQCGGGIILTFYTLLRERAKVRGSLSRAATHT